MYLRARIMEGEFSPAVIRSLSRAGCDNADTETVGFCDIYSQDGYNRLYELGRSLWSAGHVTKYEIGVFDRDRSLRLLIRPDLDDFSRNEYQSSFYELAGIIAAQRDIVPIRRFLEDYQQHYWDRYTGFFTPRLCAERGYQRQEERDLGSKLRAASRRAAEQRGGLVPCFGRASYFGAR